MVSEDKQLLNDLKCLFDFKESLYTYYSLIDTTHIIDCVGAKMQLDEQGTMTRVGEQSINVISAMLIDFLINKKIAIQLNDVGNIPSRSDMMLSNEELLEVKRIPIGTEVYRPSKSMAIPNKNVYKMQILDILEYVRYKVNQYTPENIKEKQKADYMGFYFAVSNNDLCSKSTEYIHNKLYKELQNELNVFKDIFFTYNKKSVLNKETEEHTGETVCFSLKTGEYTRLVFTAPTIEEENILRDMDKEYIKSNKKGVEKHFISVSFNEDKNTAILMKESPNGVGTLKNGKLYGYGDFLSAVYMSAISSQRGIDIENLIKLEEKHKKRKKNIKSNYMFFIGE